MATKVLAWRYDHVGDCNRYGNCAEHPYFERPTLDELRRFASEMPQGAASLEYVPADVITRDGLPEDGESGYHSLRERANVLRAAVGEALHRMQRGHEHEVAAILEAAISDFDRGLE